MSLLYFDNNATTRPLPEVLEEVVRVSSWAYGNPGSRHAAGRRARQVLETSRETVAQVLDCPPEEVVFTSGGTESINLALIGLGSGRGGSVLSPPGEHPATEECLKRLGRDRVTLALDEEGIVPADSWENVDWSSVGLATSLLAHNETGVIQDLAPLREKCLEFGIPWHVDAVQAAGKIDLSFRQLGATAMSVGAHKFHGPRGIGALLLKRGVPLTPRWFGGHQERDLRPGTEAVALASGMALALTLWQRDKVDRQQRMSALRDRLQAGLLQMCEPAVVNGSLGNRLPNTLSMAFPGCEADALLVALDLEQVCCSHGSACSSGSQEPAPILGAMGLPEEIQRSTLRFSVSFQTTDAEIDEGIRRIGKVVARIRQLTSGSEHAIRTKREAR